MYKTSLTCQIPELENIYQKYFGNKKVGNFVEIGAYDGITYSNTFGLAEMGWRGLYVEAVEEYYKKCVETHKDHTSIKVVRACVGTGKEVNLYHAGEYSTISEAFRSNVPAGWHITYSGAEVVKTQVLNEVLIDNWNYHNIDLLVIDVEGAEVDVLRGFTVGYWRPKMVIIEACEMHPNPDRRVHAPFINNYFHDAKYIKIYSDDGNNIYWRL
jgi:FkbM family methyltransferase